MELQIGNYGWWIVYGWSGGWQGLSGGGEWWEMRCVVSVGGVRETMETSIYKPFPKLILFRERTASVYLWRQSSLSSQSNFKIYLGSPQEFSFTIQKGGGRGKINCAKFMGGGRIMKNILNMWYFKFEISLTLGMSTKDICCPFWPPSQIIDIIVWEGVEGLNLRPNHKIYDYRWFMCKIVKIILTNFLSTVKLSLL